MNQNIEALREERKQIAFLVTDFLEDSDAILSVRESRAMGRRAVPWNIAYLAEKAFFGNVERYRECGVLLYLHDSCALATKGGAV